MEQTERYPGRGENQYDESFKETGGSDEFEGSSGILDDEFADEFADELADGSNGGFADEFADGGVGNSGEEFVDDDGVDFVGSEEDDENIYDDLKSEAEELGYTVTDDLTEHDIRYLIKRVKDVHDDKPDGKQDVLTNFVYTQAKGTLANKEKLATSCATMIMSNKDDEYARISSIVSADAQLGTELSRIVRNWVETMILNKFDVTDDELFQSFVEEGNTLNSLVAVKEPYIRKYIQSLRPVYLAMYEKMLEHDTRYEASRKRLATEFIRESVINDQRILKCKNKRLIRQINQCDDGSYETVCPVCKKITKLGKNAMYLIAFMTEKGVQKSVGASCNVCENEGCDTALLLSGDEYNKVKKSYFIKCSDAINAFLTVAKKECAGAAVMFTRLPFDSVQIEIPEIFTGKKFAYNSFMKSSESKNDDIVRTFVDDEEMLEAAKRFYFKLPGIAEYSNLPSNTGSVGDTGSTDSTDSAGSVAGLTDSTDSTRGKTKYSGWTPHEVAVLITQCLSKDYASEYYKALFSLALSIQRNPFLEDALSITKITSMENSLDLVQQFLNGKNRTLSKAEISTLSTALSFAGITVGKRDVLEVAQNSVAEISKALKEAQVKKNKAIADLKYFEDELTFTKIIKVSSCKLTDLAVLLQSRDLAELMDRVANRMIISNYAGDFCNYWLTLGVIKPKLIEGVCNTNSNANSVFNKLKDFSKDGIISEQACDDMWPIYKQSVELSEALRSLNRDFMTADFVGFCNDLRNIPDNKLGMEKVSKAMLDMLQGLATCTYKFTGRTKSDVYLSEFYTEDEIKGCVKCNDLLFGRYMLVPLEGETIDEYCDRYMDWNGRLSQDLKVYDLFNKFKEIGADNYGVLFSVCSLMYDAEYESFGKSIFMNAVLTDVCRRYDSVEYAERIMKVSVMQHHIVQTVPECQIGYKDVVAIDRVLHAYAMTSLEKFTEKYQAVYDSLDLKLDTVTTGVDYLLDAKLLYNKLLEEIHTYRTEDGEPISDETEAIDEFMRYLRIEVDDD